MRIGIHVSITGAFSEAPRRASELGCECFQIFAGPPRSRLREPPSRHEAKEFKRLVLELDLHPVVVHAGYLVHLASAKRSVAQMSLRLCQKELEIARELDADYYVIHTGSSAGRSRAEAMKILTNALVSLAGERPTILLENTAGFQGSIGSRFEEMAELLDSLGSTGRFGMVFDSAHAIGAGYDLSGSSAVRRTLSALFKAVGRERIMLVHANDSRAELGSGRDLHEAIGRGAIGASGFRALLADRTLSKLPFILETPIRRPQDDAKNLARLRQLAGMKGRR